MPRAADRAKAATLGEMATRAQYEVLRAGREKVQQSAPLWRRVTDSKPCGFCAMVASRGPVYGSASKAGQGNKYHSRCGCTVEPFYGDPGSWEPTADEARFIEAYKAAYRPGLGVDELSSRIGALLNSPVEAVAAKSTRRFDPKWREGRDIHVSKVADADAKRALADRRRATIADLERERGLFEANIAARKQLILDEGVPARQVATIMKKQPDVQLWRTSIDQIDDQLATVRRELDDFQRELDSVKLPDFDPANPLKFYGDRVKFYTESDEAVTFAADLELFPPGAHRALRDHFAEVDDSGFHLGFDGKLTELDAFSDVAGRRARGYRSGGTYDDVAGAYSPTHRVCGCTNSHKHGSESMALHEGSHALDDALGRVFGRNVSSTPEFRAAWNNVLETNSVRPYYEAAGNPTGYLSEAFAESYASYLLKRIALSGDELATEVVESLGGGAMGPNGLEAARNLIRWFEELERTMA